MRVDAILLTKYFYDKADFHEWMEWHLERCHFNHVFVIDNNSRFDLHNETLKYGENASYEFIDGIPVQSEVYNKYINLISHADYIMPIDDDEYVELTGFASITDAVEYYREKYNPNVLAVRWKTLFPHDLSAVRVGNVLDYCSETNLRWANLFGLSLDNTCKCIVRRDCLPKYVNREDPHGKSGTHIPCVNGQISAITQDGRTIFNQLLNGHVADEHIRLLHCRYKGPTEYKEKCKTWMTISGYNNKPRHYRFNKLIGI
jgi:hypothetical protein